MNRVLPSWRAVGGLTLSLLTVVVVGGALTSDPPTEARAEDAVVAARVLPAADPAQLTPPPGDWLSANGIVEPLDRERRVAAAVPGRVRDVLAREGARVVAGDLLVALDDAAERAALAAAEGEVAAAKADLARQRAGNRALDVEAARAEAAAAEARAALSADAWARAQELGAAGHETPESLTRARLQADADAQSARQARARRELAEVGARREDVDGAAGRLAAAVGRRDEAAARLADRAVRAPIDGEVLQVLTRAGEYQQPGGDPLVVVGDTRGLRVRADVDERDIGRVTVGAEVRVRSLSADGWVTGKVAEIGRRMGRKNIRTDDPVARNDTKVLEVVVDVEGAPAWIVGQRVVCYLAAGG